MPSSRAAHATAWPWLPALAAPPPAARSPGDRVESLLTAPRTLKEPVRCRFSAFSRTSRPQRRENVSEREIGGSSAIPSRRCRASSTSASVGAVRSVAKVEHLLHYLPHCRQRIQLAALHLVEQPPELGIVRDRTLQMRLRAAGCHGEHLAGKVLAAPFLELPFLFEMRPVRLDLRPQLGNVLAARRLGEDD